MRRVDRLSRRTILVANIVRESGVVELRYPSFPPNLETGERPVATSRDLAGFLDALRDGVMVVDEHRRVLRENRTLRRLLDQDPQGDRLHRHLCRLADSAVDRLHGRRWSSPGRIGGDGHVVRTARGTYELQVIQMKGGVLGREQLVLVVVEPPAASLPPARALVEAYGLTPREAEVALLLADGHTNARIAERLGISPHTARHHTENVLLKLDVHSRAHVGAACRRLAAA